MKMLETQPVLISSSANNSAGHLKSFKWTILGSFAGFFFWRCREIWSSEIVLFSPPLLWNLMTHQNVSGWQGGNMKQMINVKFGGFKTSTHTDTHVGTLSQNAIHMLTHWRLLHMPTPHLPSSIRTDSLKFQFCTHNYPAPNSRMQPHQPQVI